MGGREGAFPLDGKEEKEGKTLSTSHIFNAVERVVRKRKKGKRKEGRARVGIGLDIDLRWNGKERKRRGKGTSCSWWVQHLA